MNNLVNDALKNKFLECLKIANESNAENVHIVFKFKTYNDTDIKSFVLDRIFGNFYLNDVALWYFGNNNCCLPSDDIVFNIIIHNMSYNYFNLIDTDIYHGKRECCGHGEFYKTDRYTFTFYRFKEDNNDR